MDRKVTYYGATKLLSEVSKKTITTDKFLHSNTRDKMKEFDNVEFLHGKSEDLLLNTIQSNTLKICAYIDIFLPARSTFLKIVLEVRIVIKNFINKFDKISLN